MEGKMMNENEEESMSVFRKCTSCQSELDIRDFYTKGKNRIESICKACSREKKTKTYRMKKTVAKRRESVGIKAIELIPAMENYKLKILRSLS
jgi:hypothetical protein